jgi:hypothetical protein
MGFCKDLESPEASGCAGCAIEDLLVGILDSCKVASLEHGSPGSLCRTMTIKGLMSSVVDLAG